LYNNERDQIPENYKLIKWFVIKDVSYESMSDDKFITLIIIYLSYQLIKSKIMKVYQLIIYLLIIIF